MARQFLNMRLTPTLLAFAFACAIAGAAQAATYPLPPPGEHLVGAVLEVSVSSADTLFDVARRHGVGIGEITAANPGVDPWLPRDGQRVIIPARHILPDAPREGIVINLPEMRLYYYPRPARGEAPVVITHPLGIGAEGKATPLGLTRISAKAVDPPWVVPESVRAEHAAQGEILPRVVPPGPNNPLGRHALRLGHPTFLIHGTDKPYSIGMRASNGCLRMYPEDIASLYSQIAVGTPVRILNAPVKAGWLEGELYVQAYAPMIEPEYPSSASPGSLMVAALVAATNHGLPPEAWERSSQAAEQARGIPVPILRRDATQAPALQAGETSGKSGGGWAVQVGAFHDAANACMLARRLNGLESSRSASVLRAGPLCKVLVGPYASREDALAERERIMTSSSLPGVVVQSLEPGPVEVCSAGEPSL